MQYSNLKCPPENPYQPIPGMEPLRGRIIRSGNGHGPGPEFGMLYQLEDGRYMGCMRHHDRGDLVTNIRFGRSQSEALPDRWR